MKVIVANGTNGTNPNAEDTIAQRKKAVQTVEANPEESKANCEKFCTVLKNLGNDIAMYGYSGFKEAAKDCGATKTLRRGLHWFAYFGFWKVSYRIVLKERGTTK